MTTSTTIMIEANGSSTNPRLPNASTSPRGSMILVPAETNRCKTDVALIVLDPPIDDPVIARHLAAQAAAGAGVDRRAVEAWITRRRVDVTVTPASGYLPDQAALQRAADASLDELAPQPRPRARVRVSERGAVGGS